MNAGDEENPIGDEEDPFVEPRLPARRINRRQRSHALTVFLRRHVDMLLQLAAVYLLDFQDSLQLAAILTMILSNILSNQVNNNDPSTLVTHARLAILTTLNCAGNSLQMACQVIQMGYNILFVRQSERQANNNGPARKRTIESLTEFEAYAWTRFRKSELVLLLRHLRLPAVVHTRNRYRFTGEEILIFCLTRIALGLDFTVLVETKFGGSATRWSEGFRWFVNHIYFTFYHRISGDSMRLWLSHIDEFRRSICLRVNADSARVQTGTDENGNPIYQDVWVNCDPLTFRIFAFLDDTGVQCCRPAGAWGFFRCVQRAFYSRYFRGHGLKYQTVFLPNGLFGSVFGASWNRNDNGMVNLSGLSDYLAAILSYIPGSTFLPALYGDAIFALSATILSRFPSPLTVWQAAMNIRMSAVRICEEHAYGQVFNLFRLLKQMRAMTLLHDGATKRRLGVVTFFLYNCYTCCYGNGANTMFDIEAPTLEQYLPLDENFAHAPDEFDGLDAATFDESYRWG